MRTKRQKQWLEIAEAFGTPWQNRTVRQQDITRSGLCLAVLRVMDSRALYKFRPFIYSGPRYTHVWVWPMHVQAPRRDFALLMAAMNDRDYNEICAGIWK